LEFANVAIDQIERNLLRAILRATLSRVASDVRVFELPYLRRITHGGANSAISADGFRTFTGGSHRAAANPRRAGAAVKRTDKSKGHSCFWTMPRRLSGWA
jgi:hypothetical protein